MLGQRENLPSVSDRTPDNYVEPTTDSNAGPKNVQRLVIGQRKIAHFLNCTVYVVLNFGWKYLNVVDLQLSLCVVSSLIRDLNFDSEMTRFQYAIAWPVLETLDLQWYHD